MPVMTQFPLLWEAKCTYGSRQRSELMHFLSSRQSKLQEDASRKSDKPTSRQQNADENTQTPKPETTPCATGTGTGSGKLQRAKQQTSKSFFWSDLLSELNTKSPISASTSVDMSVLRKSDRLTRVCSEPFIEGYSVSECPFGHRRLVGSTVLSGEAINCRHCRYSVALHEQRNRQQRKLAPECAPKAPSDTFLPDIRENVSSRATEPAPAPVQLWSSLKGFSTPPSKPKLETKVSDNASRSQRSSFSSFDVQIPRVFLVGSSIAPVAAESKVLVSNPSADAKTPNVSQAELKATARMQQSCRTAKVAPRTNEPPRPAACASSDRLSEIEIPRREPEFYSTFANPFDSRLPAAFKERLAELQRLEFATVRKERDEEARKRMKRARKRRPAADDAADDE